MTENCVHSNYMETSFTLFVTSCLVVQCTTSLAIIKYRINVRKSCRR